MYMDMLFFDPIAELSASQTMSALFVVYSVSNTATYSDDLRRMFYLLLFRAYVLITHAFPPAVMDVLGATVPAAGDGTLLCAAPELKADVAILARELTLKFDVFSYFADVVQPHQLPRPRRILLSELSFLLFWLASAASDEEGSPMRAYYVRQQLRAGEEEFYRRIFSAGAVDDANFVLGTMRGASFQRIQEDALRSPAQMLTDYVRRAPDESALLMACYHTLFSHFVGRHPDLARRLGGAVLLEHEIADNIDSINDKLHPLLVQCFNHMQLMCTGRVLYMYNNVACSLVAWFRELYARHDYSLCGVHVRASTIDPVFAPPDWRTARVREFHVALRRRVLARCADLVVHDWDPYNAAAPPADFDYGRFPDNLVRGRPAAPPLPVTDAHVRHVATSLERTRHRFPLRHGAVQS